LRTERDEGKGLRRKKGGEKDARLLAGNERQP
jgi:hypothetical protein